MGHPYYHLLYMVARGIFHLTRSDLEKSAYLIGGLFVGLLVMPYLYVQAMLPAWNAPPVALEDLAGPEFRGDGLVRVEGLLDPRRQHDDYFALQSTESDLAILIQLDDPPPPGPPDLFSTVAEPRKYLRNPRDRSLISPESFQALAREALRGQSRISDRRWLTEYRPAEQELWFLPLTLGVMLVSGVSLALILIVLGKDCVIYRRADAELPDDPNVADVGDVTCFAFGRFAPAGTGKKRRVHCEPVDIEATEAGHAVLRLRTAESGNEPGTMHLIPWRIQQVDRGFIYWQDLQLSAFRIQFNQDQQVYIGTVGLADFERLRRRLAAMGVQS